MDENCPSPQQQRRLRLYKARLAQSSQFAVECMTWLWKRSEQQQYVGCCPFCGNEVSTGEYQLTWGFTHKREQGGANALALRETIDVFAHLNCVESRRKRYGKMR